MKFTSVANTMVLMSGSPLVAAVLARFVLGERLSGRTLIAIALALAGITVMVAGSLGGGGMVGNLFALLVAVCFGANIVVLRSKPGVDMVPTTMIAGILSALMALPFASPLSVSGHDLALVALMGCMQLALGLLLFVTGSRHLSSAETGLLTLLESVLAPIWVWIGIGETPTVPTLVGGSVVLAALVLQATAGAPPSPVLKNQPAEA
ncbi:MAG TPA: DMT family transporter, partial [Azospirillaceae bacterium]|nr:DMT family transporter [Azospirillaceae bacterium]